MLFTAARSQLNCTVGMPTTRGARAARRAAAERQFLELPADVLGLVLYQLPLAHDIALTGLTCRALCDAAKLALKARPYSGEVVKLAGHKFPVICVAATHDGRVVTAAKNATINVWDGFCTRTILHSQPFAVVAVLAGGTHFVFGSARYSSAPRHMVLESLDGARERSFEIHSNVNDVASMPDGAHFVVAMGRGANCGEVMLYHVDGTLVHSFKRHCESALRVEATPDGQHIISGACDNLVKVWHVASKSLVSTCAGHTAPVLALAAMPDGQRFLSGSLDDTVRVWLLDGTPENTFLKLHTMQISALVALPDNLHALSGSRDMIKLFNVNDGAVLRTFKHQTGWVGCLALLPDGLRFVSGSDDRTARIAYHGLAPVTRK